MKRSAVSKPDLIINEEVSVSEYLSTGSTILNLAISCMKSQYGGLPTNRITEFSGTGASGKTYICGELCGDALRRGYDAVYVDDIERRWDISRLKTFGFTAEHPNFRYLDPSSTTEKCFEDMFRRLDKHKEGTKVLYIVDPIAALYSKVEVDGSDKMGQARAKALQRYMRHLKDRVNTGDKTVTIVFSNQLIDAVGVMFGEKKTEPCGNAMKHWPSIRVRFSSPSKITKDVKVKGASIEKVEGIKLYAVIRKNSEDDAYREAEITIQYGYGIDDIRDCSLWLKKHTTILDHTPPKKEKKEDDEEKAAKWFKLNDYEPQYGLQKFIDFVEVNDLEDELRGEVSTAFRTWYAPQQRKPKYEK